VKTAESQGQHFDRGSFTHRKFLQRLVHGLLAFCNSVTIQITEERQEPIPLFFYLRQIRNDVPKDPNGGELRPSSISGQRTTLYRLFAFEAPPGVGRGSPQ
jgi:hypothetical protein